MVCSCVLVDCTQSLSFLLVIERVERATCATAREQTGLSKIDGCAVLGSLQSLNYCEREKTGTACSLASCALLTFHWSTRLHILIWAPTGCPCVERTGCCWWCTYPASISCSPPRPSRIKCHPARERGAGRSTLGGGTSMWWIPGWTIRSDNNNLWAWSPWSPFPQSGGAMGSGVYRSQRFRLVIENKRCLTMLDSRMFVIDWTAKLRNILTGLPAEPTNNKQ